MCVAYFSVEAGILACTFTADNEAVLNLNS